MRQVILASSSLVRQKLLNDIGFAYEVCPSDFDERKIKIKDPKKLVKKLSLLKALSVKDKFKDAIIISADTVMEFRGEIIGKPKNEKDAFDILKKLSGNVHQALTGYTIVDTKTERSITKVVSTKVFFRDLIDTEIRNYIKTKEPLNKAGAYGIQSLGGLLVERFEGDYFNVIGLPLNPLFQDLKKFGVKVI